MRRAGIIFATVWSAAIGMFIAFGPLYGTSSRTAATNGSVTGAFGGSGLVGIEGAGVLLPLVLPVLIATLPLMMPTPHSRDRALWVAVTLFGALSLLGAMTVGLLYLPAFCALLLAAARPGRELSGSQQAGTREGGHAPDDSAATGAA